MHILQLDQSKATHQVSTSSSNDEDGFNYFIKVTNSREQHTVRELAHIVAGLLDYRWVRRPIACGYGVCRLHRQWPLGQVFYLDGSFSLETTNPYLGQI